MRFRIGFCIVVLCLLLGAIAHAAEPVRFERPVRVAWLVEEVLDGQRVEAVAGPGAWRDALKETNLVFVDSGIQHRLSASCDLDDMVEGDWCETITSAEADIVLTGQIKGESRKVGQKTGVKAHIKLRIGVVDDSRYIAEIKLPPYGTGDSIAAAFTKALAVVKKPVAIQLSHAVNTYLAEPFEGSLTIAGFADSLEREDPLASLRYLPGVTSLILSKQTVEKSTFTIGYSGITWHQLIDSINTRQGTGIDARITGNKSAEGRYNPARAFRLLVAVAQVKAHPKLGLDPDSRERLAASLGEAVWNIQYAMRVKRPQRLPHAGRNAIAAMKREFGGDLVLLPSLVPEGDAVTLIVEVWSTFAGRLFSVTTSVVDGNYSAAAQVATDRIAEKLPGWLMRRENKMPRLKRKQFKAWQKATGQ